MPLCHAAHFESSKHWQTVLKISDYVNPKPNPKPNPTL
jgi:hypothetical protein